MGETKETGSELESRDAKRVEERAKQQFTDRVFRNWNELDSIDIAVMTRNHPPAGNHINRQGFIVRDTVFHTQSAPQGMINYGCGKPHYVARANCLKCKMATAYRERLGWSLQSDEPIHR